MSHNLTEHIEEFILGQLSQEDNDAFEKALITDQSLKEEVAFLKLAIKGTKQSGNQDLKDRLKRIQTQYESDTTDETETKIKRLWPRWIGAAASVVILITSGLFLFSNDDFNSQVAFEEYYQPVPLHLANRDLNVEKAILQLNNLYSNKEYDKALSLFQKLMEIDSTNNRLRLGAGICHLELNDLVASRSQFLKIIEAEDFRLKHQANWYMALTYLKEGKLDEVQNYLAPIISDSKADHHNSAIEIIERLRNF